MKIHPVGAVLFQAVRQTDERTDMTKLIVVLRNFANVVKKTEIHIQGDQKVSVRLMIVL